MNSNRTLEESHLERTRDDTCQKVGQHRTWKQEKKKLQKALDALSDAPWSAFIHGHRDGVE